MFLCKCLCVLQTYFHRFYNQLLNETLHFYKNCFGGFKKESECGSAQTNSQCRVVGIQQAAENAVKQRRDHSRFDFSGLFSLTRQFSSILTMAACISAQRGPQRKHAFTKIKSNVSTVDSTSFQPKTDTSVKSVRQNSMPQSHDQLRITLIKSKL